jgi:hypothetical protein
MVGSRRDQDWGTRGATSGAGKRGVTGKWTTQRARGEGRLMGQDGLAGPAREEKKYTFYFNIHFPINT